MVMTLDAVKAEVTAWYTPLLGTFPDPDGAYGAQCKDLISHYIINVHNEPYVRGNGIAMASNLIDQQGWKPISASARWQIGDVVSTNWGGAYGHVYVVLEDYGTGKVKMIDLNGGPNPAGYDANEAVKVRTTSKTGVVAVARPPRYAGATATQTAPAPAPVPQTQAQVLAQTLSNVDALISAAKASGVPLHIAAAMISKESNGKNVYGGDYGGIYSPNPNPVTVGGVTYAGGARVPVTASNYMHFLTLLLDGDQMRPGVTSNGVGPAQITYWGFHVQARNQGLDLSKPHDNMLYGLRILAGYLADNYSQSSVERAGTSYNAGASSSINAYGRDLWVRSEKYRLDLAGAVESTGTGGGTAPVPGTGEDQTPEQSVPTDPSTPVREDPGATPALADPGTWSVRQIPRHAPGPTRTAGGIITPLMQAYWRGQWWDVLEAEVSRDLGVPGPDQSPLGGGMVAATGTLILAKPEPVSVDGWNVWRDNPPATGEAVRVRGSTDGGQTWVSLLVGKVDGAAGSVDDLGVVMSVVDHTDRLAHRITIPPLNFRMPSTRTGFRYMCLGLHPAYFADRVARRAGWYSTPRPDAATSIMAAPMVGSAWAEIGTLIASETMDAKGSTEGVSSDSPSYVKTWWGLAVTNLFARYTPWTSSSKTGRMTGALGIQMLVGPTKDHPSYFEQYWDRDSIMLQVSNEGIRIELQTGWLANGNRSVKYGDRVRGLTEEQKAKGFELRVWFGPDGAITTIVDGVPVGHTPFPGYTSVMRDESPTEIRVTTRPFSAPLGGVIVASTGDRSVLAPFPAPTFLLDADPNYMIWGSPALVKRTGLEMMREHAAATLASPWIDEDGRLRFVDRVPMDARKPVRTITLDDLVTAQWEMDRGSVVAEVDVSWRQPSLFQNRRSSGFWATVWEGPDEKLAPGAVFEELVHPGADEDWFYVHQEFNRVSDEHIGRVNRGEGSILGGTTVLEEGGEKPAPISWYWGSIERLDWRTFRVTAKHDPPDGVTADLSLTVPELDGLRKSRIGNGPLIRARGKQTWGDFSLDAPVRTGTDLVRDEEYVHEAGWWVQSAAQARRIADRLAQMLAEPLPTHGPVEMAVPDLSLRLGDTVTLQLGGYVHNHRVCGVQIKMDDSGMSQQLTLRQIHP